MTCEHPSKQKILLLFSLVFYSIGSVSAVHGQSLGVGDKVPKLSTAEGTWINSDKPVTLSALKGRVALIVFETVW